MYGEGMKLEEVISFFVWVKKCCTLYNKELVETIIFGLSSIYLAYLSRYKNLDWGLKLSFVLIFLFHALRFDVGND